MRCPQCNGTGEEKHYRSGGCGGPESWMGECSVCRGTGAVRETKIRHDAYSYTCGTCNGSGKVKERYVKERYPSGKVATYGERSVTCSSCKGSGKGHQAAWTETSHSPDYQARAGGSTGCLLLLAAFLTSGSLIVVFLIRLL